MSQAEVESTGTQESVKQANPTVLYKKCQAIANNLWWSWHPDVANIFRDIDPIRWRQLDHNPIALLKEVTPDRLESRATEMALYSRINWAYRQLKSYMTDSRDSWGTTHAGVLALNRLPIFRPSLAFMNRFLSIPAAWEFCPATTSRAPVDWLCQWSPSVSTTTKAISSSG